VFSVAARRNTIEILVAIELGPKFLLSHVEGNLLLVVFDSESDEDCFILNCLAHGRWHLERRTLLLLLVFSQSSTCACFSNIDSRVFEGPDLKVLSAPGSFAAFARRRSFAVKGYQQVVTVAWLAGSSIL